MDIRKLFLTPNVITTFMLTVVLAFPRVVQSVSIGDVVVLQSMVGEPLLAQVELMVGNDEHIKDACLSLALPDPLQEDISGFLTKANLSLKTEGKRQYVSISSLDSLNNAYAKLRLHIQCPGIDSITKTLSIPPPAQTPRKKQSSSIFSKPKLSSESVGESHIREISAEERAMLLAQQKLLEGRLLTLQQQVRQLEGELSEIKIKLSELGVSPPTVAASATVSVPISVPASAPVPSTTTLVTANTQGSSPKPTIAINQSEERQDKLNFRNNILVAIGLALVILALWLGLRYYIKTKSRIGMNLKQGAEPILKPAIKLPSQILNSQVKSGHAPAVVAPFKAGSARTIPASPPLPAQKIAEEMTEEDSMLEEAGLYATYGHSAKAVEILKEIVKRHPMKADAWPLLLSIYSSLGKSAEFENTAREFLKHHKNSPSWSGIRALGRTLDPNNPLYADNNSRISASPLLPDTLNLHRLSNSAQHFPLVSVQPFPLVQLF